MVNFTYVISFFRLDESTRKIYKDGKRYIEANNGITSLYIFNHLH